MLEDPNAGGTVTEIKKCKRKIWKKVLTAFIIVICITVGSLAAGGYYLLNLIRQVPLTEVPEPGTDFSPE